MLSQTPGDAEESIRRPVSGPCRHALGMGLSRERMGGSLRNSGCAIAVLVLQGVTGGPYKY